MKAFLLAAGLGTRLRPLTDELPKCLLPVGGRPLLDHWLGHLERHGVEEVLLNTHWRAGRVREFLDGRPGGTMRISVSHEPTLLGSAGTLLAHRDRAGTKPFYIIYADNLTDVDLTAMARVHAGHGLPLTLGVFRTDSPRRAGIVTVDRQGRVTSFEEKPDRPRSDLAAAGIYVADSRIFEYFPARAEKPLDLGYHILPRLTGRMQAYRIREFLVDIGTPESYRRACREWLARARDGC